MRRFTLPTKLQNPKALTLSLFVVGFAIVGTIMLFRSFALGTSTISGYAFQDANRNGVMDAGEAPWSGHELYLFDATKSTFIAATQTDASGLYTFSSLADGTYLITYSSSSWSSLYSDWTPTTTGTLEPSQTVTLAGTATANFGWRPITKSTDLNNPISKVTEPSGLQIKVYNDALTPAEVYSELQKGSLVGSEQASITILVGYSGGSSTAAGVGQSNGTYSGYHANSYIDWVSWITQLHGHHTLFHEYGHAWSQYYDYMVQQDGELTGYQKARGIYGDSRVNSSYAWNVREMIAEDYRELFGGPGSTDGQANRDVPFASDVPGLKEYLSGAFLQPPLATMPAAPTNLTATAQQSTEGPAVQLSWGASSGAASYEVYRNGTKIGSIAAPSTTYYDSQNLTYSTAYSYYVKAVSSTGTASPASNTVTVTTPAQDTTPPSPPSGLVSPSQTQTSINLSWTASTDNTGVVGYKVYQVGGSRKNQYTTLLTTTTNTSFTVTGLKRGTFYSFYVTAIDAAGNESLPTKTLTVKTRR